ncbi:hypothetical protein [Nitratireductor basaltis]|uniref:Uncharacterized protein n=1 Tax=Nitratireductor basaltis TaxID=472175 RepID=A0A084U719_9HYPH|nr:hypothetical protein [Nitratireductor basaltis]KFB08755.1 hypothetical protein EL18_03009 [Nitratireductor basaltis]
MVKRGASIGFFGRFGRSQDMRNLDRALRFSGLHPAQVPEGVKLAAVGIIAGEGEGEPPDSAYPPAGELMALCALGEEHFAHENGQARTESARNRLERALEEGEGIDAELILLLLHAKLIHPVTVDQYDLRAVERGD